MLHPVHRRFSFALLVAVAALASAPAHAQTPTQAELLGSVRSALGDPIQNAVLVLLNDEGESIRSFRGGLDGSFAVRGVGLGVFRLRVEALGFRPQLLTGVVLRPGSTTRLDVVLRSEGSGVDTISAGAGGSGGGTVGRWIDAPELRGLPGEEPSLASWVPLSTLADESLGLTGLPSQFTSLFIDGLPFRPVRPLGLRTIERGLGLAGARTVEAAEVAGAPSTLSLPFGAGGAISVHSVRGTGPGLGVDVAGSAGSMRMTASEPDDPPSTLSFWGGATASFAPKVDTTSVLIGFDAWQIERPREGLLPSAGGDEEGVGAPYVERRRGLAGFARFDHALSGSGSLWGTGRLAVQPAATDLTAMAWGLADTGERVDLLVGGGFVAPVGRRELIEVRIGLGRSAWTAAASADAELPFEAGAPTFLDAATGLRGGPGFIEAESADRLDFDVGGSVVMERDAHRIHLGVFGGVASHSQDFSRDPWVTSYVGSGGPTGTWTGGFTARRYRGETTASVPRFTAFAEDAWSVAPGVDLRFGASFESEWLPLADSVSLPNPTWFAASGLTVPTLMEQVSSGSGFFDLEWTGADGTRLDLGASYESHEVDPALVLEVLAARDIVVSDGDGGTAWPAVPPLANSPNRQTPYFVYFVEPPTAPATWRLFGTVSGSLSRFDVSLGGVFRRTEGLTRRRDLNRAAVPHGVDRNGRALWAQPWSTGAWLHADPRTLGRFSAFGPVLELDQGGWSEYLGVTARLGYTVPGGTRLIGEYTWSRTEDNVPGIASQGRLAGVPLETLPDENPTEGVSDLDVPHRLSAGLVVPLPIGSGSRLSAVYRFRSGTPFTPGYSAGVDANLDGVVGNDPAFVSEAAAAAHADWSCLDDDRGAFATRNGCRGDAIQTVDLRLDVTLASFSLFVDAFNVLDQERSVIDTGLLRVAAGAGTPTVGPDTALPFQTSDSFGSALRDLSPGRTIRVGVRVNR